MEGHFVSGRLALSVVFSSIALPFTLILAFLAPPFQVPDEFEHYFYARSIVSGHILPQNIENGGRGGYVTRADAALARAFRGIAFHANIEATESMFERARQPFGSDVLIPQNYSGASIYPPVAYIAPAIGMFVSDAVGAGRLSAFYVGRVANALLFVGAVTLAIWVTPVGRPFYVFLFLLPMSVFQAASFSADSFAFGSAAVTCAVLGRIAVVPTPRHASLWGAAILISLLSTVKPPLIAFLLPLVLLSVRTSRLAALGIGLTVTGICAAWTIGFSLSDAFSARMKTLQGASSSEQLVYLFDKPAAIIGIAFETFREYGLFYLTSGIGILGWLDTPLAGWYYALTVAVGCIALAGSTVSDQVAISGPVRIALATAGAVSSALIFGALYLSWTPVGAGLVQGVQGRYLIPPLLIVGLSVSGIGSRHGSRAGVGSALILLVFGIVSMCYVVTVLVERYYLR